MTVICSVVPGSVFISNFAVFMPFAEAGGGMNQLGLSGAAAVRRSKEKQPSRVRTAIGSCASTNRRLPIAGGLNEGINDFSVQNPLSKVIEKASGFSAPPGGP
jgi:hypothetical protein